VTCCYGDDLTLTWEYDPDLHGDLSGAMIFLVNGTRERRLLTHFAEGGIRAGAGDNSPHLNAGIIIHNVTESGLYKNLLVFKDGKRVEDWVNVTVVPRTFDLIAGSNFSIVFSVI